MKKIFLFLLVFLAGISAFAAGVAVQREHLLRPLKRLVRGLPLQPIMPPRTTLDFNFERIKTLEPLYPLGKMSFSQIQSQKSIFQKKIYDLIQWDAFPHDYPPQAVLQEKTDLGRVIREKILVGTEPGMQIPLYLFIPKSTGPHPVILVLHGHSAGKIETGGLASTEANANARLIAEQGFATIAPDFRGFGELGWPGEWSDDLGYHLSRAIHIRDVMDNISAGRTVLGSYLHDLEKVVEALEGRPELDFKRMGVAGTSMGADVALWLTVLDNRIKAVVSSHPPLLGYPRKPRDYDSYHACINTIPGIEKFFRLEEIPLLVIPTPLLFNFSAPPPPHRKTVPTLETLYQKANIRGKFSIAVYGKGEEFDHDQAIVWFKRYLSEK